MDTLGVGVLADLVTSYLTSMATTHLRACSTLCRNTFRRHTPPNTSTYIFLELPDQIHEEFVVVVPGENKHSPLICHKVACSDVRIFLLCPHDNLKQYAHKLFDDRRFLQDLAHHGHDVHHRSSRLCLDPEIRYTAQTMSSQVHLSTRRSMAWSLLCCAVMQYCAASTSSTRRRCRIAGFFLLLTVFPFWDTRQPLRSPRYIMTGICGILLIFGFPEEGASPRGDDLDEAVDALFKACDAPPHTEEYPEED